jgi:hypothetical protein
MVLNQRITRKALFTLVNLTRMKNTLRNKKNPIPNLKAKSKNSWIRKS